MSYIQSYCTITPGLVCLNGKIIFKTKSQPFVMNDFFSAIYTHLKIDYRKFYKMDALSKLGFLASEILLTGSDREKPKNDMGILFFNKSSSLEADINYQKSIQDNAGFFPSPSDFVHTLPNIVTGEIAIRNRIHGETVFYITSDFDGEFMYDLIDEAIVYGGMKCVLGGWVEVDVIKNDVNCFMMICTKKKADERQSHLPVGLKHIQANNNQFFNEFTIFRILNI